MKPIKKFALIPIAVALMSVGAVAPAIADVTFNLDVVTNGSSPSGSNPSWMTATFHDVEVGKVVLTMTNNMSSTSGSQFIDALVFNSILNPTSLTFTYFTDPAIPGWNSITKSSTQSENGGDQIKAGLFNIFINYAPPPGTNEWMEGMTSEWTIEGSGLTSSNFLLTSIDEGCGPTAKCVQGGYYMAAHVQGIPGDLSGSIAAIPEPETYAMLLAGLGLMGFVARRRQRKLAAA